MAGALNGAPLALLASLLGWLATGFSMQPWLIVGWLPIKMAVSSVSASEAAAGLLLVLLLHAAMVWLAVRRYQNHHSAAGRAL